MSKPNIEVTVNPQVIEFDANGMVTSDEPITINAKMTGFEKSENVYFNYYLGDDLITSTADSGITIDRPSDPNELPKDVIVKLLQRPDEEGQPPLILDQAVVQMTAITVEAQETPPVENDFEKTLVTPDVSVTPSTEGEIDLSDFVEETVVEEPEPYGMHLGADKLILIRNGKTESFDKSDSRFHNLVSALREKKPTSVINSIIDASNNFSDFDLSDTGLTHSDNGDVMYGDWKVPDAVTGRLKDRVEFGLDIQPWVKFIHRLFDNPSYKAVNELAQFIERGDLPITEDGHFLAYKLVQENYMDVHSGTVDYSIGKEVTMRRNEVDDNSSRTCSAGLHAASFKYLRNFPGKRLLILKISPADVVSIPVNYDDTKGRFCRVKVVGEYMPFYEEAKKNDILAQNSVVTGNVSAAYDDDLFISDDNGRVDVSKGVYELINDDYYDIDTIEDMSRNTFDDTLDDEYLIEKYSGPTGVIYSFYNLGTGKANPVFRIDTNCLQKAFDDMRQAKLDDTRYSEFKEKGIYDEDILVEMIDEVYDQVEKNMILEDPEGLGITLSDASEYQNNGQMCPWFPEDVPLEKRVPVILDALDNGHMSVYFYDRRDKPVETTDIIAEQEEAGQVSASFRVQGDYVIITVVEEGDAEPTETDVNIEDFVLEHISIMQEDEDYTIDQVSEYLSYEFDITKAQAFGVITLLRQKGFIAGPKEDNIQDVEGTSDDVVIEPIPDIKTTGATAIEEVMSDIVPDYDKVQFNQKTGIYSIVQNDNTLKAIDIDKAVEIVQEYDDERRAAYSVFMQLGTSKPVSLALVKILNGTHLDD